MLNINVKIKVKERCIKHLEDMNFEKISGGYYRDGILIYDDGRFEPHLVVKISPSAFCVYLRKRVKSFNRKISDLIDENMTENYKEERKCKLQRH